MDKNEKIHNIRHTLAHLLAASVRELYPGAQNAIGPAIDDGFYQDFDLPKPISVEDFPKIEKKMREILKTWNVFERREVTLEEAKKELAWNPYKTELIEEFAKDGKKITFYTSGSLADLCKGGHLEHPNKELSIECFKLDRMAGAYWRGNEQNKMLTRIYGLAFETKEELEAYITQREEAEKRDHRKLGKELDLFCFSDVVGPGLPLFTPRGTIIIDELQKHIETVCRKFGFEKVKTPSLAKRILFETSGHATKFADELFSVTSPKDHQFNLKPVQCPHQTQIYASKIRSYKELPIRYMESDKQYRAEKTGEIGGLNRVYAITVEDGHTFCRVDQIKQEVINTVSIIKDFYTSLGLWKNHWVSLSVRDYSHPEKYIGDIEDWDFCEKMLQEISDEMNLKAKKCEGEAALYGPKLDFMFKDALGKEIQIPTIQLDFATPKRFKLIYIDKNGKEVNPVMIHRAILGSYERFLVLLIEHFMGAFPLWLAPVQVKVIPVRINHNEYAKQIFELLKENNVRAELDDEDENLGTKVRDAKTNKIPYWIVLGDKEVESGKITLESRDAGRLGQMSKEKLVERLLKEIRDKK